MMPRRPRSGLLDQRGVSLIELLVTVVVLAVLFLIIDLVFINTHRSARKVELTADASQNARIAVERLSRELRESGAAGIQVDGSTAVMFRTARPADASSAFCVNWRSSAEVLAVANPGCSGIPLTGTYAPVWQRWIGYYFDNGASEVRRVASTSALTFPLSGGQVVATSVQTFTIISSSGTYLIRAKGRGQEVVQGSAVPPQEVLLEARVGARN
jgi:prepilin-type N-terminal cleavage/methylation domain-containing protein